MRDDVQLGEMRAITLFPADLAAAWAFYAEVFGGEVVAEDEVSTAFDARSGVVVNMLQVGRAPELTGPGDVAPPGGSRLLPTVAVPDIDAACPTCETARQPKTRATHEERA